MNFQKAYENSTEPEFNNREERNAWLDYSQARSAGQSHEMALEAVKELAEKDAKFQSLNWAGQQESEIERKHRESCQKSATNMAV